MKALICATSTKIFCRSLLSLQLSPVVDATDDNFVYSANHVLGFHFMDIQDAIKTAKDKLPDVTPTPPAWHSQATVHELKSRLNWGEPGLTILDMRDHEAFRNCHIMGAMNMTTDGLSQVRLDSLPRDRDLYVYGDNDQETANAANMLRQAGFPRVAELKGGLSAWREIDGSVEGIATNSEPVGRDAYNVASRLQEFSQVKAKEHSM